MNAAEEIVKYWYEQQGYFCMESIKVGRREIDLLAIKLKEKDNSIQEAVHVEVQVSINYTNFKETVKQIATRYDGKFNDKKVQAYIQRLIGKSYHKIEVRGKMALKGKDIRPEYIKLRKRSGITVIPFEKIFNEVTQKMGTDHQLNPIIQAVQLAKYQ